MKPYLAPPFVHFYRVLIDSCGMLDLPRTETEQHMSRIPPYLSRLLRQAYERIAGPQLSPTALLTQAPPAVAEALRGQDVVRLPASPQPKQHWMFQVGQGHLLHMYGGAAERIRRSLPDRELFQRDVAMAGLPLVRLVIDEGERLWLLEERLAGAAPDPAEVEQWFPQASAWLVRLAGPPGPPLRTTPFWEAHGLASVEVAPAEVQPAVGYAWELLGDLSARSLHGDVQPRNLILGSHGVGLVDWEGFWRYGLPGLDLVFLALMSAPKAPDQGVLEVLTNGKEPPGRPLQSALYEAGLTSRTLHAGLLAMLATWALGEARRVARSRRPPASTPFRAMLAELGPQLARGLLGSHGAPEV